ncbi:hypothetical protein SETIT_7G049800v2 [Setaria italica]|uniref:PLAT domain-containing protein n=1 Tax=Setaria italica TaxID=4555 RepID=K3YAF0_SETIT|nr:PLAT domain-containing protein 3 [Setaria italica]RCV33028.1 hypothetical protein SETIT_7G049800v2 [Setaria italica]
MKSSSSSIALTCCLLLALVASHAAFAAAAQCTFEIIVKTGGREDAGTDSRVSLQVSAATGRTLTITNLESWGKMPAGHDYFERGHLDRFSGKGRCLPSEPCKMVLRSDGQGHKPGWYVDYVKVTQLGSRGSPKQRRWAVDQWLAIDEAPNQLFASRDGCGFAAALP